MVTLFSEVNLKKLNLLSVLIYFQSPTRHLLRDKIEYFIFDSLLPVRMSVPPAFSDISKASNDASKPYHLQTMDS